MGFFDRLKAIKDLFLKKLDKSLMMLSHLDNQMSSSLASQSSMLKNQASLIESSIYLVETSRQAYEEQAALQQEILNRMQDIHQSFQVEQEARRDLILQIDALKQQVSSLQKSLESIKNQNS